MLRRRSELREGGRERGGEREGGRERLWGGGRRGGVGWRGQEKEEDTFCNHRWVIFPEAVEPSSSTWCPVWKVGFLWGHTGWRLTRVLGGGDLCQDWGLWAHSGARDGTRKACPPTPFP